MKAGAFVSFSVVITCSGPISVTRPRAAVSGMHWRPFLCPWKLEVSHHGEQEHGCETLDISCGGILFTTGERLQPGCAWNFQHSLPKRLTGSCFTKSVWGGEASSIVPHPCSLMCVASSLPAC